MTEANIAVLIDFENVGLDSAQDLLDQLSDLGRIIIKRAYADWSVQRSKRDQILELGIEAIHHFRSTKSGKNSSDICLAIDAVELMYGAPIDTFVIVSSDSDFVPLVSKLRAAGKSVIGSGRRGVTSPTLVKSCDRYIYLNESKTPAPASTRRRAPRSKDTDVNSLVVRAMEASMGDQGQVVGSKLHNTMQRIDPSFNFKSMGFRTFRQFLNSCKEVRFTQPEDASDVIVQLSYSRERGYSFSDTNGAASPPDESKEDQGRSGQPEPKSSRHSGGRQRRERPARVEEQVHQRPTKAEEQAHERFASMDEQTQDHPASVDEQPHKRSAKVDEQARERPPQVDEQPVNEPSHEDHEDWEIEIDSAWTSRQRDRMSGPVAAGAAAKILGVTKLSLSKYASLDALLGASKLLRSKWRRERNTIHKI